MNRKDQLKAEYERKRAAGGFDAPVSPRPEDFRRAPVRGRWTRKFKGVAVLAAFAAALWCGRGWIAGFFSSGPAEVSRVSVPGVGDGAKPANGGDAANVTVAQVKAFLTPSEAEIVQLYNYVLNAPFLAENVQYRDRMKIVAFRYEATNDVVNAYAGRRLVAKDGKKSLAFHMVFLGGAARYARLVGLAAALEDSGHEGMLKKFVAAMPRAFCARCNEDACVQFIAKTGLGAAFADEKIRQKAISYSSGTIVGVLAHEAGHHALGHLMSFPDKENLEIDRNQEREADSFASSIISASPFGEYVFAGTLFWHYAVAMQADGANDRTSDHPLSKERFENFVRANAEKAAAMGITVK